MVKKYQGRLRFALSITGTLVDQLKQEHPEVIDVWQQLARTGCVEFLSETYYHSLAFLYSRDEFKEQVQMHMRTMRDLFGQRPRVFRNTELIYSNDLAKYLEELGGYIGVIAEGADHILGYRSPNQIYTAPGTRGMRLLLKNYRFSDDIAFRFSNRSWPLWPLTADKYVSWISQIEGKGSVCNLFMDYETFGEHQWAETGIFNFVRALPEEVFKAGNVDFRTPSECVEAFAPVGEYDVPHMISWADTERDLSAWVGNAMQSNALHEMYQLEARIKARGEGLLLADWRNLTTCDHFYYMCTKYFADADVHKYFNPYESPYDSYINFMNVLDNLRTRVQG
jgi:alpha-amylase